MRHPSLSHACLSHRAIVVPSAPRLGSAALVAGAPMLRRPLLQLLDGAASLLSSLIHELQGETLTTP